MIDKIRKTHEKKTEWGRTDNFAKSAKKAGKRIRIQNEDDQDDWQTEVRNVVNSISA
jgi:hypothetical protein